MCHSGGVTTAHSHHTVPSTHTGFPSSLYYYVLHHLPIHHHINSFSPHTFCIVHFCGFADVPFFSRILRATLMISFPTALPHTTLTLSLHHFCLFIPFLHCVVADISFIYVTRCAFCALCVNAALRQVVLAHCAYILPRTRSLSLIFYTYFLFAHLSTTPPFDIRISSIFVRCATLRPRHFCTFHFTYSSIRAFMAMMIYCATRTDGGALLQSVFFGRRREGERDSFSEFGLGMAFVTLLFAQTQWQAFTPFFALRRMCIALSFFLSSLACCGNLPFSLAWQKQAKQLPAYLFTSVTATKHMLAAML